MIRFLGLFDTVKRVDDGSTYDISFLGSIFNVRHALALNETCVHFKPETYDLDSDTATQERSLIEAWFVGSHADLGGGAKDDGLSLYPLQWMMLESKNYGIVLEHRPGTSPAQRIEDPIQLVLPTQSTPGSANQSKAVEPWSFRYANGLEVKMWDLRPSHNHGNLQALQKKATLVKEMPIAGGSRKKRSSLLFWKKDQEENAISVKTTPGRCEAVIGTNTDIQTSMSHFIRLNPGPPQYTFPSFREPFDKGKLRGYCELHNGMYKASLNVERIPLLMLLPKALSEP